MSRIHIFSQYVKAGDMLVTANVSSVVLSVDVQRFDGLRAARVRIETRSDVHFFDPGELVAILSPLK